MKNKHPVLRRFMRRKVSVVAAALLILFVLIAILGPLVWQVDPLKQSVMKKYGPMTVQHPLGTDNLGRDTLARMIYGARVSLAISFAGVLSELVAGLVPHKDAQHRVLKLMNRLRKTPVENSIKETA